MSKTDFQDGCRDGHLGFLINMILANFDPEVLLLQSKCQLISTKRFGTVVENGFSRCGRGSHLGFSIGPVLTIMCLLGAPMLLIVSIQLDHSL